MKKTYTLITLLFFLAAFNAQAPFNYPVEIESDCNSLEKTQNFQNSTIKSGLTIWSEDFANGFPSGWTIQDLSGICPEVAMPPDSSPPKSISSVIILPAICLKPICTISCFNP